MKFEAFVDWVKGSIVLPAHLNTNRTVRLLYWSNKLGEESGEAAGVISKMAVKDHIDQEDFDALHDELGDVMYVAIAAAAEVGVDWERVFRDVSVKLVKRYRGKTFDKSGES